MENAMRILICDDQPIIHETLGMYLEDEGYEFISAYDGEQALVLAEEEKPSLILLDLMMPKKSGIDVCREIRQRSRTPIIMLTAKGEELDRILGLELGADDYIVKPFSAREVMSRIKAVLRRINLQKENPIRLLQFDKLTIDISNYEVRYDGLPLQFSPKEVEILYLLASSPGKVFEREKILTNVWGCDYYGDTRAVDTQIKRIRQKLPQEGVPWGIKTIYGIGYKFEFSQQ